VSQISPTNSQPSGSQQKINYVSTSAGKQKN
jgi:hypothetical protein